MLPQHAMASLQIRDLPDPLHRLLTRRASACSNDPRCSGGRRRNP
ncbi:MULTISPECIES: hypothetical protein [unclassified Cyanobium]|nr:MULTISPECIES: hypothetical protein [unclassified Cyanobium]